MKYNLASLKQSCNVIRTNIRLLSFVNVLDAKWDDTNINTKRMIQIVVFGTPEMFNVFELHLNVRSLNKNLDKSEALILGLSSPPSVLRLSETWLSENDDKCFLLHGYSQYLAKCSI